MSNQNSLDATLSIALGSSLPYSEPTSALGLLCYISKIVSHLSATNVVLVACMVLYRFFYYNTEGVSLDNKQCKYYSDYATYTINQQHPDGGISQEVFRKLCTLSGAIANTWLSRNIVPLGCWWDVLDLHASAHQNIAAMLARWEQSLCKQLSIAAIKRSLSKSDLVAQNELVDQGNIDEDIDDENRSDRAHINSDSSSDIAQGESSSEAEFSSGSDSSCSESSNSDTQHSVRAHKIQRRKSKRPRLLKPAGCKDNNRVAFSRATHILRSKQISTALTSTRHEEAEALQETEDSICEIKVAETNGEHYMRMFFRLNDDNIPRILENLESVEHSQLRHLAKTCGLKTSRSSELLLRDLQFIQEGKQHQVLLGCWSMSRLIKLPLITIDGMRKSINVHNTPEILKEPLKQYLERGYTVIPSLFSKFQLDLSFREWNYHTQSRGIDLSDRTTWHNIQDQHDWKQGWAKWLFTTGIQTLANTHPLLYAFVAAVTGEFALTVNWYEAKIHLPNTGGAFMHNDLNWFKLYELACEGIDVQAVNIPQIVVFMTDTIADQSEFFLIPSMYKRDVWFPIIEGLYQHRDNYCGVSAMDILKIYPQLKKDRISIQAKAGDVLIFNSLITHGPSDNHSSVPQLRCYPNIAPIGHLVNSPEEVLSTYLNGTHPTGYGHFFTGNGYKESVVHACSSRRHYAYPLCSIGRALVGAVSWTDPVVAQELRGLFSSDKQQQDKVVHQWIEDFNTD